MEDAPRLLDRLAARGRRALRRGARAARRRRASPTRSTPTLVRGLDYYTRTVFEFTSDALGAQCGRRRRRPLRRAGRAARRAAHARASAGPPASSGSCSRRPARRRPREPRRRVRRRRRTSDRARGVRARCALRATGCRRRWSRPGRSLKGQLKQADRLGARWTVIVEDDGFELKDMETRRAASGRERRRAAGVDAGEAAAPEPLPRPLGRPAARGRRRQPSCASPAGCTAAATTAG